jgi:hypothetical protein
MYMVWETLFPFAGTYNTDKFDMPPVANSSPTNSSLSLVNGTAGGQLYYTGFANGNDTGMASSLQAASGNGWIMFDNATQQAEGQPHITGMNNTVQNFDLNSLSYACISTNASDPSAEPIPTSCAIQASVGLIVFQELVYTPSSKPI